MMVATLLEDDYDGLRRAVRDLDADADAFEVRIDALKSPVDFKDVRRLTAKPLIATCRRKEEGGQFAGSEHERLDQLEAAREARFDYLDLEGPTRLSVRPEHVIRSRHDLRSTPGVVELVRRGRELAEERGGHAKHASRIDSFVDTLNILEAIPLLREQGVNATLLGLGEFPRAVAHLLGNEFTYGGGRRNAPGQPPLRSIRSALRSWGDPAPSKGLFLVVGRPLQHSLSPKIHNAAFRATGMQAAYAAMELRTDAELIMLLNRGSAFGLKGLSVTSPLKEAAWAAVDRSTPEAQAAKSVNCIKVDRDIVLGHNTDGIGARRILDRLLKPGTSDRVLLLGSGGAARGILAAARGPKFTVAGRDEGRLQRIHADFKVDTMKLDLAPVRASMFAAIVNATAVEAPMPLNGFRGAIFDLHYADVPTAWERHAKAHKLPFVGGRELLLEQAIPAFEFWTGRSAPREAMEQALRGGKA